MSRPTRTSITTSEYVRAVGGCLPSRKENCGNRVRKHKQSKSTWLEQCVPRAACSNGLIMAQQPASPTTLIDAFGPHLAFPTGQRLDRGVEADRLVKTHCCF